MRAYTAEDLDNATVGGFRVTDALFGTVKAPLRLIRKTFNIGDDPVYYATFAAVQIGPHDSWARDVIDAILIERPK
jgi:hypothetical protein